MTLEEAREAMHEASRALSKAREEGSDVDMALTLFMEAWTLFSEMEMSKD